MTYTPSKFPPAAVQRLSTSGAVATGADGWSGNVLSLTLNRTGQWLILARASASGIGSGARITNSGGTPIGNHNGYFWHLDAAGAINASPVSADWLQTSFNNGDTVYMQVARSGAQSNTAYLDAWFIPIAANPQ